MTITAILAGANIDNYDWLSRELALCDTVICADSGLRHADHLGIAPHIIIGDFDSVDRNMLTRYEGQSDIIHDTDQNATDLMKALAKAPKGHKINIYGAVGQRADHDFSNYLILLDQENCNGITLKTEHDDRRIITSPLSFQASIDDMIGVFPLRPIKKLSYKGLKYPAEGLGGSYQFGWNGSCNTVISEAVEILIDGGAALITHTFK